MSDDGVADEDFAAVKGWSLWHTGMDLAPTLFCSYGTPAKPQAKLKPEVAQTGFCCWTLDSDVMIEFRHD